MEHNTTQALSQNAEAWARIKKVERTWTDDFIGSAEDLAAVGLVKAHQFPGMPGIQSTSVKLWQGEYRPGRGGPQAPRAVGRVEVYKAGRKFRVAVTIPRKEGEARRDARAYSYAQRERCWNAKQGAARQDKRLQAFIQASIALATAARAVMG